MPGIGKKGAQKIILELTSVLNLDTKTKPDYNPSLILALKSLGYKHSEALSLIAKAKINQDLPLEKQLKAALKAAANK